MTDETTTEQLAEIEGQTEPTPATEYTPPEGWRVLRFGEPLKGGDEYHAGLDRYIRRTAPQPEPQPQPQPEAEPVQVREGRWRTRRGDIKTIRPCEPLRGAYYIWPWTDGFTTYQDNGRHLAAESDNDLVAYLGPIEPQPETQPEPEPEKSITPDNVAGQALAGVWNQAKAERTIEELRCEVSYVQRLLGESRRRVTQLEELTGSLRTINETQNKAFTAAGKENTALRNQLAAVKAELATVAADRQRLQIELDAAQQVPADSPELQQLWVNLAEVAHDRDTYKHAHELLLNDVNATHARTKAMTVEAIVEWLVPIRTCGSQALATAVVSNLPHIMRSLTGLEDEDIE